MRKMSLSMAVFLLVAGAVIGSIFTFGMQFWNDELTRAECVEIKTQFLTYEVHGRRLRDHRISIECANDKQYDIDGASITSELKAEISLLPRNEEITLLLHPNSDKIVEFSTETDTILSFDKAMDDLDTETTGFLLLGLFMYLGAVAGLYNIILHCKRKKNRK